MRKTLLLITAALAGLAAVPQSMMAQNAIKVTVAWDCLDSAGNGANGASKPSYPVLIAQDGTQYKIGYKAGENSVVTVPAGTYDLYTAFAFTAAMRAKVHAREAYVVKEGLNLTSDTTLAMSLKDAKNHIHFDFMLPNGEKFVNTSTESSTRTNITTINVDKASVCYAFSDRTTGGMTATTIVNFDNNTYTNGVLTTYNGIDLLLSDMSTNCGVGVNGAFQMKDDATKTPILVGMAVVGCDKSATLVNDASKYVTITDNYRLSPKGETSTFTGGGGMGYVMGHTGNQWERIVGNGSSVFPKREDTTTVVLPRYIKMCDNMGADKQDLFKHTGYSKLLDWGYFDAQQYNFVQYMTESPIYELVDGKPYATIIGTQYFINGLANGQRALIANGHPEFNYFKDQMGEDLLGNSVPVVSVATRVNQYSKKFDRLFPSFVGRYGEVRGCDQYASDLTVKLNDSIITQAKLQPFINVTNQGKLTEGKLNVTIADSNVYVDNEPAQNITNISIDLSKAQRSVPSLQMLQFRNTATGKVTDRFDVNSPDAEIRLAGASFYNEVTNNVQVPIAAKMQVSYSPSGKNEWKPLEVTEEPANFQANTFGNFYRGNLEQIQLPSTNKWYDLKVVITDDNGNTMQQELKPAFRIEKIESTGVADVNEAKAVQSVRYYDLTGRQSAEPTTGINIKVTTYTDGTSRSEKVMK